MSYRIEAGIEPLLQEFSLPERLGFGQVLVPIMFTAEYENGKWGEGVLRPYGPLSLDPAAKVLHYAQEAFEGLKAYKVDSEKPTWFRPLMNWERLNDSARRLCMPEIPQQLFMDGIGAITAYSEPFIPSQSDQSLYLRPFMIGTQPGLGMAVSDTYTFAVIASPSEVYHQGNMHLFIERKDSRVANGDIGAAKVGGNYAAALQSATRCKALGYDVTLWLDPVQSKTIDELSGMNFFAVIDGELHTPALTGTILPGITRNSVIQLARAEGMVVQERRIDIDELIEHIKSGHCSEAFACGTAAVIAPIAELGEADGTTYPLQNVGGEVTTNMRERLIDLQEGRAEDPFDWMVELPSQYRPQ
jgi:branched-chain amino acid aminotransferase